MPRFNVTVTFSLISEFEPEYFNLGIEDVDGVSNFEDGSYWNRKTVESNGGQFTFQVEAEDDNAAYDTVHEVIREDMEIEDNDSVTWTVNDLKVEIEEVEEPMDKDKAKEILRIWLNSQTLAADVRLAIHFLLDSI